MSGKALQFKKSSTSKEISKSLLPSVPSLENNSSSIINGSQAPTYITRASLVVSGCNTGLRWLLILFEFAAYPIVFCYVFANQHKANHIWLLNISYLEGWLIMQIIIQFTMIIFCMVFYLEIILYADPEWIEEVKELKRQHKQYRDNSDSKPNKMLTRHKKRYRHKQNKNSCLRLLYDCNMFRIMLNEILL